MSDQKTFECYVCKGKFNIIGEPVFHYGSEELPKYETASVCESCKDDLIMHLKEEEE